MTCGALLALAVVGSALVAGAEKRQEIPEAILRGAAAEASTVILFDEPRLRKTTPTIELVVQTSDLVDLRRSTLSVSIDDRPYMTARLGRVITSAGAEGRVTLAMAGIGAGYHAVRVIAHLVSIDEECEQDAQRRLWVRTSGAIHWRAQAAPASQPRVSTPREVLAALSASPELDVAGNDATDTVAAYLEADRWRRRWALPENTSRPRIRVVSFYAITDETIELARAIAATPAAIAIAGVIDGELTIVAAPWSTAARAVRGAAAALDACDQRRCWLAAPPERPGPSPPPRALDVVVKRLAQDTPDGFVARGLGRHVLRWRWARPSTWALAAWPELRLLVASSDRLGPDSSVTVHLADVPLATFRLTSRAEQLVVRIPPWAWARPSWDLHIDVRLVAAQAERCAAVDESTMWLHIAPESSLAVPRDQPKLAGLAAFFSDPTQPAVWVEDLPTSATLERFAAVANQVPGDSPWRVVGDETACAPRCLALRTKMPVGSRLSATLRDGAVAWIDRHGRLPLASGEEIAVLERRTEGEREVVSAILRAAATPPDTKQLDSDFAIWAGSWTAMEPRSPDKLVAVRGDDGGRAAPVATPRQERTATRRDAAWIAVSLLALLALLRWIMRARKA